MIIKAQRVHGGREPFTAGSSLNVVIVPLSIAEMLDSLTDGVPVLRQLGHFFSNLGKATDLFIQALAYDGVKLGTKVEVGALSKLGEEMGSVLEEAGRDASFGAMEEHSAFDVEAKRQAGFIVSILVGAEGIATERLCMNNCQMLC